MKILRTKFLEETWEIKLRKDSDVSDWLPATFKDGTMSTIIDGVNMSGEELQQNGYVIEEKKFDSTPIAQVPAYGYNRDTFSMASIKWLEWYAFDQKSKGKQMQICHALNGGEKVIPNTNYRADGIASTSLRPKYLENLRRKSLYLTFMAAFGRVAKFVTQIKDDRQRYLEQINLWRNFIP